MRRQSKIEIRHTAIIIHDYNWNDCEKLEQLFSIYDKVYHRAYPKGIYYDSEKKDLYLPAGIDLYYVISCFGKDIWRKVYPDRYYRIDSVRMKYKPRDDDQTKALQFCVGEGNYDKNRNAKQLSLNLSTGKGKTYIAITVFAYYCTKTMMITSSINWIDQWFNKILEYTDLKPEEIYIIQGSASITKLLKYKDCSKIKFFLCSHDTLNSYASSNGWYAVTELFQKLGIGIKIFDEAHLYYDSMMMIDFFTDVWRTYYLTATPGRSDRKENYIYSLTFKNVPKIDLFDEENDPHTDYIAVLYNSHPTAVDISNCNSSYGFSMHKYTNYLINTHAYYKIIHIMMDIIMKNTTENGKALIFIGTNHAILVTYWYMKYHFPLIDIGIYTTITPKEIKAEQLNKKIILSTIKSSGTALDIPNLEMTVNLNDPFKSELVARQTLGRTRARGTRYVDLVDIGFTALQKFYNHKMKVYKKYASNIYEYMFNDQEIRNKMLDITKEDRERLESKDKSKMIQVIERVKRD